MKSTSLLLLATIASAAAFVAPSHPRVSSVALSAEKSRTDFLRDVAAASVAVTVTAAAGGLPAFADETLPSGVVIKVQKEGKGPKPDIGELAAIRFASFNGQTKIDDVFDTPEPYYTRVGSGGLIKGVEEVLPKMRVGDRWVLTIPASINNLFRDGVTFYVMGCALFLTLARFLTPTNALFGLSRATLPSDRRAVPPQLGNHAFPRMPKSFLTSKWLVFQGRSRS